jgi:uncharacterized membrane protein
MSESLYLLTICLPFGTILLVFGMRYLSAAHQAKARFAQDDAYRRLAEQATSSQSETAAALASINTALADAGTRLAAIETILKAVE